MMEIVKTLATLHEPDVRRTFISVTNCRTGEQRRLTFQDIEERVSGIPLPTAAPAEIKDQLVTAKNLLLYSWYFYPFSTTASFQAVAALEQALRLRLAQPGTLRPLLNAAVAQGLLSNDGFPRWKAQNLAFGRLHREAKETEQDLVKTLTEVLPTFRNVLAHGNRLLDDIGFLHLDIVCEAIEQLFPSDKGSE